MKSYPVQYIQANNYFTLDMSYNLKLILYRFFEAWGTSSWKQDSEIALYDCLTKIYSKALSCRFPQSGALLAVCGEHSLQLGWQK